jgi:hypothetical protein
MRAIYADYEQCLSLKVPSEKAWLYKKAYADVLQEISNVMISDENVVLIQNHLSETKRI